MYDSNLTNLEIYNMVEFEFMAHEMTYIYTFSYEIKECHNVLSATKLKDNL